LTVSRFWTDGGGVLDEDSEERTILFALSVFGIE